MSQKKIKQARAQARREQQQDTVSIESINAMQTIPMANTPMDGLRLGWRAMGMVAKRPFASLPMLIGVLAIWLPAAGLLANLVALALFGDGPMRKNGVEFGFLVAIWMLLPVLATIAIEAAFLMAHRGKVRWRVALASFRSEKGMAWLVAGSLLLGLALQAVVVVGGGLTTHWMVVAVSLGVLLAVFLHRIVIFLASAHLWSGEVGGWRAIKWAICALPRVAVAWASAMLVMLFAFMLMGTTILSLGWLVMASAQFGGGVQMLAAILLLWPALAMAIGAAMAMEGRIMLELHALAATGPNKPVPAEVDPIEA